MGLVGLFPFFFFFRLASRATKICVGVCVFETEDVQ